MGFTTRAISTKRKQMIELDAKSRKTGFGSYPTNKESSSKRCRYGGVGYIFDHTDGRNAYFDKRFEMERLLGTFECPKKFQLVSTIFQHVVTPLEKKFSSKNWVSEENSQIIPTPISQCFDENFFQWV